MSGLCSVNWYWLLAARLPIRTGGGFLQEYADAGHRVEPGRELADQLIGAQLPLRCAA
jgi:hypothetical protein